VTRNSPDSTVKNLSKISSLKSLSSQITIELTFKIVYWCPTHSQDREAVYVLQGVAVCCCVVQRGAVCCSVLRCVAVRCIVLQSVQTHDQIRRINAVPTNSQKRADFWEHLPVSNPTINSYKRINAVPTISGSSWSPNTVRRDMSYLCVTWLINMCDVTPSYVWHDSVLRFPAVYGRLIRCAMTHSYAWRDSFKCVTWPIHMCGMTPYDFRHFVVA